jgi:hypothetical protein
VVSKMMMRSLSVGSFPADGAATVLDGLADMDRFLSGGWWMLRRSRCPPEHARSGRGSGAAKSKLRQKEAWGGLQGTRRRGPTAAEGQGLPKGRVHARLETSQKGANALRARIQDQRPAFVKPVAHRAARADGDPIGEQPGQTADATDSIETEGAGP